MTKRTPLALLLVFGTLACSKPEPVVVSLSGDTMVSVVHLTFDNGASSAECGFVVKAAVSGGKDASATLTKGQIVYTIEQTGDTIMKRPIDAAAMPDFFEGGSATIQAGSSITSKRQGLSVSQPVEPLRGSVTFDYTSKNESQPRTTEPFVFHCR